MINPRFSSDRITLSASGSFRARYAAESGRFLETFMVASWLEHLRQHQRVTNTDRAVQDDIREFGAAAEPKVTHFIAANFR